MQRLPHAAAALSTLATVLALAALPSALAATASTSSAVAGTGTCSSAPADTLSFACDSACAQYEGCLAPASDSTACRCLKLDPVVWTLLLPYDAATSSSLASANLAPAEMVNASVDFRNYTWVNNAEVHNIAPLSLAPTVQNITIRGGSSLGGVSKGFLAGVKIDPKFLAGMTQITAVQLSNLQLTTASINTLVENLPASVKKLDVKNTALTTFPTSVKSIAGLQELDLAFNNIAEMSSKLELPKLTKLCLNANKLTSYETLSPLVKHLDLGANKLEEVPPVLAKYTSVELLFLGDNSITTFDQGAAPPSVAMLLAYRNLLTSFDVYLPNIVELNLDGNKFKKFPPAIFSYPKLKTLYIGLNNELIDVDFTNAETNFLHTLENFFISSTSLKTDCANDQKFKLKSNITVCVTGGIDKALIAGPRIVAPSPAPTPARKKASTNSDTTSSTSKAPLIGGICAAIVVVAIVLLIVWRRGKSAGKSAAEMTTRTAGGGTNQWGTNDGTMTSDDGASSLWRDQELLRLKVDYDDIEDVKRLGSGAFADVWLVTFRGSERLASKRLRVNKGDAAAAKHTQAFIDEIKMVAALTHPNIVELKGVAWIRESDLQALFEFMDAGDLREYLQDPQHPKQQWTLEKLQIAIDVVEALVYVHSFLPPLVHRDLKSRNVLLTHGTSGSGEEENTEHVRVSSLRAKLTDFGVSRFRSQDNTMTAGVGTGRWLAPEVIRGDADYGTPSDVYSYGAVLFELDSHAIPYADVCGTNGNALPDVAILQRVACGELTPTLSATCPVVIATIARACFALDPAARPKAPEIAWQLRSLQKRIVANGASVEWNKME